MSATLINFAYLVASVLFILGLKGLTHPRTAVRGNLLGALGMLLAVVVTLLDQRILSGEYILLRCSSRCADWHDPRGKNSPDLHARVGGGF